LENSSKRSLFSVEPLMSQGREQLLVVAMALSSLNDFGECFELELRDEMLSCFDFSSELTE
jgi:hypothetical protein